MRWVLLLGKSGSEMPASGQGPASFRFHSGTGKEFGPGFHRKGRKGR